jgi:hypothetical protein
MIFSILDSHPFTLLFPLIALALMGYITSKIMDDPDQHLCMRIVKGLLALSFLAISLFVGVFWGSLIPI